MHFLNADDADAAGRPAAGEALLRDAEAYALLLEIVCGLRSPLLGETEIQAQFKQFLSGLDAWHGAWLRRIGERILGDAKDIRARHLQGFGAHSYGRLASRHVRGGQAAIVGTGALAVEVLDHVDPAMPVDVWGRRPDSLRREPRRPIRRRWLASATSSPAAQAADGVGDSTTSMGLATSVVVAAPVGERDLNEVLHSYRQVVAVIDLRAADQQTPVDMCVPVVTLGHLLGEAAAIVHEGGFSAPVAALDEVHQRAQAFARREHLRPFGWEDLCA